MGRLKKLAVPLLVVSTSILFIFWIFISSSFLIDSSQVRNFSGPVASRIALKNTGRFRLAVLSDVHNNSAGFETVMADVVARGADAAIILGDFTHRGLLLEKRLFIRQLTASAWPVPVFTLVGNHDLGAGYRSNNGDDYRRLFGTDHYWWRFGQNLFIAFNNAEHERRDKEYDWLRQTVAQQARPGDAIYLMAHKPFLSKKSLPGHPVWDKNFGNFLASGALPGLKATFTGHLHLHDDQTLDGVRAITVGNIGDFDGSSPVLPLEYMMLDCTPDRCDITQHNLGEHAVGFTLVDRVFVEYYYFWLACPLVSLAFLAAAIFLRHRTLRPEPDPQQEP